MKRNEEIWWEFIYLVAIIRAVSLMITKVIIIGVKDGMDCGRTDVDDD